MRRTILFLTAVTALHSVSGAAPVPHSGFRSAPVANTVSGNCSLEELQVCMQMLTEADNANPTGKLCGVFADRLNCLLKMASCVPEIKERMDRIMPSIAPLALLCGDETDLTRAFPGNCNFHEFLLCREILNHDSITDLLSNGSDVMSVCSKLEEMTECFANLTGCNTELNIFWYAFRMLNDYLLPYCTPVGSQVSSASANCDIVQVKACAEMFRSLSERLQNREHPVQLAEFCREYTKFRECLVRLTGCPSQIQQEIDAVNLRHSQMNERCTPPNAHSTPAIANCDPVQVKACVEMSRSLSERLQNREHPVQWAEFCGEYTKFEECLVRFTGCPSDRRQEIYAMYLRHSEINEMCSRPNAHSNNCGGDIVADKGIISSPDYPNDYGKNEECIWKITVPANYVVKLKFHSFQVEITSSCLRDYVEIHDGPLLRSPSLGKFCGYDIPVEVVSSKNKMTIKFKYDSTTQYQGFTAEFQKGRQSFFTVEVIIGLTLGALAVAGIGVAACCFFCSSRRRVIA